MERLRHRLARGSGFTLVELLIVVAIMAILVGLLSGAIRRSVTNAREQRINAEIKALNYGLVTYWHETGRWPAVPDEPTSSNFTPPNNWDVFKYLLKDFNNSRDFIDDTSLTYMVGDAPRRLSSRPEKGGGPLVYKVKNPAPGADLYKPYKVTINLELNTVTVSR